MDNFREWLSDNLRYILLILFIAAVAAVAFFGIRFFLGHTSSNDSAESRVTESTVANSSVVSSLPVSPDKDSSSEDSSVPEETNDLLTNEPSEIAKLVQDYYTALTNKDVATIGTLVDVFSDDDSAKIVTEDATNFSDVNVYTKKGLEADSYVAYAYYKYSSGDEADMPGLSQLYVIKNSSGNYVIKTQELSAEEQSYVNGLNEDQDVKDLIYQVQREYDEATADESAQESTESQAESTTAQTDSTAESTPEAKEQTTDSTESQAESTAPAPVETRAATITSSCNVRTAPSYDGAIIGEVTTGTQVTVIGGEDGGWYHIQANGLEGYVGHWFVS